VVAPEHVKGYIYIEAFKQTHVKAAIGKKYVNKPFEITSCILAA
jgi:hypothetical protein